MINHFNFGECVCQSVRHCLCVRAFLSPQTEGAGSHRQKSVLIEADLQRPTSVSYRNGTEFFQRRMLNEMWFEVMWPHNISTQQLLHTTPTVCLRAKTTPRQTNLLLLRLTEWYATDKWVNGLNLCVFSRAPAELMRSSFPIDVVRLLPLVCAAKNGIIDSSLKISFLACLHPPSFSIKKWECGFLTRSHTFRTPLESIFIHINRSSADASLERLGWNLRQVPELLSTTRNGKLFCLPVWTLAHTPPVIDLHVYFALVSCTLHIISHAAQVLVTILLLFSSSFWCCSCSAPFIHTSVTCLGAGQVKLNGGFWENRLR